MHASSTCAITMCSRIEVALVPLTCVKRGGGTLTGRLVRDTIVAFFDDDDDDVDDNQHYVINGNAPTEEIKRANGNAIIGHFKPPILTINGVEVPCVIAVPNPVGDCRLVVRDEHRHDRDELTLALSLYGNRKKPSHVNGEERPHHHKKSTTHHVPVPEYLVQFCKATSLASSATPTERITWDQVSMTIAIRDKPIDSPIAAWIDVIAGLLALLVLAQYWQVLATWMDEQLAFEDRTLKERVEFVMSKHAPLGFKLNPQADFVLGNLVILVVDAWHTLTSYPQMFAKEIIITACVTAALLNRGGGLSVLFAVAFDAFAILGTHVGVLHRVISRILRFQLALIGSLALLMRGKKRNVLRNRVDTLRTDSAQLMLGTMAIFFFSFTLQTTLAYHILVLAVWSLIFLVQTILFFICVILRSLPIDEIRVALQDRKHANSIGAQRPRTFHIVFDDKVQMWRVQLEPVKVRDVISDWSKITFSLWTRAWARRWGTQKVLANVLFGYELPTVPPPAV